MRGKEGAAEYRYFPDPDLPPIVIQESWIESLRSKMPVLPEDKKESLIKEHSLSPYDAEVITGERENVEYFDECVKECKNAKAACNWITSELFGVLKKEGMPLSDCKISAESLGQLIAFIEDKTISGKMAKTVFEEMFETGRKASEIIEEKGLKQISDPSEILSMVTESISSNPKQVQGYLSGKDKLLGFFVGQIMKASKGSANPELVNKIIKEELDKLK